MTESAGPKPVHTIEGHAIVSLEGAIADASGGIPDCLRNDADWALFQRALDESVLTVLGRASHEAVPNPGRRRLVLSTSARQIERLDQLTWKVDPGKHPIAEALASAAPEGGRIAVVGGRAVFDLFLAHGYDAFYLSIAERCRVEAGIPVFTGITSADQAIARLRAHRLKQSEARVLDETAGVVLHRFER